MEIYKKTFDYSVLAKYYDDIYSDKNYKKEAEFIRKVLERYNVETVLDVGCGTGNHMAELEKYGFKCEGLDISAEMLSVAREKVKGSLFRADMRDFNLGKTYDAIICMFAVFNYNLTMNEAERTLSSFRRHLNDGGIVLLDLHNVWSSGKKTKSICRNGKQISVEMKWTFDEKTRIEHTVAIFKIGDQVFIDEHTFRIFTIQELEQLFQRTGFSESFFYENYTFREASTKSKNIEVVALK